MNSAIALTNSARRALLGDAAQPWLLIGAIMLGSLVMRQGGSTPDVSWLTSMCARMLDGETGWVDIFETTPPVPTLLYMPGVIIARALGLSVAAAQFGVAYLAGLLALICTARLLPMRLDGAGSSRWAVILPATVVLFVLSSDAFAQREYFAAAFTLPVFAVFVRRAQEGEWPSFSQRIFAALLAGFAFAIKPPLFALPFMALAACECARTRRLDFLFPSMLPVAAATGVALTAASLALFPAYLDGVTTLMRDVYVPIRGPMMNVFDSVAFIGTTFCLALCLVLSLRRKPPPAVRYAMVLSAVFIAIYILQGKFFAYHLQPAALFAVISLAVLAWPDAARLFWRPRARASGVALYSVVAAIAAFCFVFGFDDRKPRMHDLSWAQDLDHPTALAISPIISISFPLAEQIGARWIDRIHSQWVVNYTHYGLEREDLAATERERYQHYQNSELARVRRLIRDKKPEVIIQCAAPSCRWLSAALLTDDPALLNDYELIAEEGVFHILRRRGAE